MDRGKLFMIWFFFLPLLNLKIKKATTFKVALQPRESLKGPIFLCHSQSSQVLIDIIFFCNPRLISKKIHPPFDFRENSSSFDFRENPLKTPKENQKICFSFASCDFWICFKGLFVVVPLDLNFTNPKSTIFEPDFVSCVCGLDW